MYFFRNAIDFLKSDPEGWKICRLRERDITPKKLHGLFQILETRLSESKRSTGSMQQVSSNFRKVVLGTKFLAEKEITVESVNYKSFLGRLRSVPQPILNMGNHLTTLESESPLGAMPHKNYLDLIEKSADILQADLDKLIGACNADLLAFKLNRLKMESILSEGLTIFEEEEIISTLYKKPTPAVLGVLKQHSAVNILATFLKGVLEHTQPMSRNGTFRLHGLARNCAAVGLVNPKGCSYRQTFFSPERLTTAELQAVFILLLCRTGWNQDSLVAMDRDGIISNEEGFAYVLQGFKEKTDDDAPPIFIEKSEADIIYAIK
jgi:hypothetical protein